MEIVKNNEHLVLYSGVFETEINNTIFELAALQEHTFGATQFHNPGDNPKFSDWRKSRFTSPGNQDELFKVMISKVKKNIEPVMLQLKVPGFEISHYELQQTAHNDGDFYKRHVDGNPDFASGRIVTFVYYFHSLPKMFSGGELILYPRGEDPIGVQPENNTMVFFKSGTLHEVKPVLCPSKEFRHGRFTLNGWVCKRQ